MRWIPACAVGENPSTTLLMEGRMDLGLKGKIAVVFASSQGIGRGIALRLAQEGARVAICARGEQELSKTEGDIRAAGGDVMALTADCLKYEDIKHVVKSTAERWGTVHVLVTNAGGPPPVRFEGATEELWEMGLNLNLLSTIRMCREAIPHMKAQKWGRIIHITSTSVKEPFLDNVLSNVARSGVMSLNKTLALEYAPYNITSNNIAIGSVWTARSEKASHRGAEREGVSLEEYVSRWTATLPARRNGTTEEVGALAAFLASEQAGYITGQNISIDGGMTKGIF